MIKKQKVEQSLKANQENTAPPNDNGQPPEKLATDLSAQSEKFKMDQHMSLDEIDQSGKPNLNASFDANNKPAALDLSA